MPKIVEKNYCHCIQQIKRKNPKINPYAICTDSVYGSKGLTRDKVIKCDKYYSDNDYLRSFNDYKKYLRKK